MEKQTFSATHLPQRRASRSPGGFYTRKRLLIPPAIHPGGGTKTEAPAHRRWDPVVKLTHWSIALAVLANAVFTEEASANHVWVGYGLAAILGLRLLWGLIGPAEARFGAFPPSPRRAVSSDRKLAVCPAFGQRRPLSLGPIGG